MFQYRLRALLAATIAVSASGAAAETTVRASIAAGTILTPEMLDGDDLDRYVGLEAKRSIWPNRPITERDVGPPQLVARNQIVEIVYRAGALDLRDEGRALDAGAAGEDIRVLNIRSRQIVRGTVSAPSQVSVSP